MNTHVFIEYLCVHVLVSVSVHACVRACVRACVCVTVCACICVHVPAFNYRGCDNTYMYSTIYIILMCV